MPPGADPRESLHHLRVSVEYCLNLFLLLQSFGTGSAQSIGIDRARSLLLCVLRCLRRLLPGCYVRLTDV